MEQNKNYIYTVIGIGIIIVIGLFFWNTQTAESPVDNSENTQQEQENMQNGENNQEGEQENNQEEQQNGGVNDENDTQNDSGNGGGEQTNTSGDSGGTSSEPSNDGEDDPTANWRTYQNNSLGLTFKFPSEWRVTENSQAGEYTLQVYAGTVDDKTIRVNMLIHEVEINQAAEAGAKTAVNGQEAYVYTNTCQTGTTCVMNRTIFPREGTVNGGVWTGNAVEITAITEQSETTTLRNNVTNLINSVSLN